MPKQQNLRAATHQLYAVLFAIYARLATHVVAEHRGAMQCLAALMEFVDVPSEHVQLLQMIGICTRLT